MRLATRSARRRSTWTHIALCVKDIDKSIAWYERFTHLTLLQRGEDKDGKNAWLGDSTQADSPFVLVLGQFFEGHDPFAPAPHLPMGPFAHIGIELPTKEAVDEVAGARQGGRLPRPRPGPVAQADRLRLLHQGSGRQHDRVLLRSGRLRKGARGLGKEMARRLTIQAPQRRARALVPPPGGASYSRGACSSLRRVLRLLIALHRVHGANCVPHDRMSGAQIASSNHRRCA